MEHYYQTLGAPLTTELSASVRCPNPVIADMAADMPKNDAPDVDLPPSIDAMQKGSLDHPVAAGEYTGLC